MANAPIKTYKKGKISLAVWQGNFEGKPTTSFSIKKSVYDKTTNSWKDSIYYSVTDLQDVQSLCNLVISKSIENAEKKPVQQKQAVEQTSTEQSIDDDCPW